MQFYSLIWLCYRKNFKPLFLGEEEVLSKWLNSYKADIGRDLKIGHMTDTGWGCTIRVAQMMLSHTFLRHHFREQDIFDIRALPKSPHYIDALLMVNDNTDGGRGAFSIRNITRMSLVYDKFPGEWHGPGSISLVIRDLNKLY